MLFMAVNLMAILLSVLTGGGRGDSVEERVKIKTNNRTRVQYPVWEKDKMSFGAITSISPMETFNQQIGIK